MINPRDFIEKKIEEAKDDSVIVSGSFICDNCSLNVSEAKLNEDTMTMVYVCANGHKNEATL